LTKDACREQFNLEELGMLRGSAHGEFTGVRFHVTFPDGTPAYKAQVSILSRGNVPFTAGFQTDQNGYLDLQAPLNQEFAIDAYFFSSGVSCRSAGLRFNTERGVRWQRMTDSTAPPNWGAIQSSSDVIELRLAGPSCHP
jgi:hypothetical protein